jgi:hypothetical protein
VAQLQQRLVTEALQAITSHAAAAAAAAGAAAAAAAAARWGLVPSFTKQGEAPDHFKMVRLCDTGQQYSSALNAVAAGHMVTLFCSTMWCKLATAVSRIAALGHAMVHCGMLSVTAAEACLLLKTRY